MAADRRRLAVLGSPIDHSLSPLLHRTAYAMLGLDWRYDAIDIASGELGNFLKGCGAQWRGLSLTMPLKYEARAFLTSVDAVAEATGATNTILFGENGSLHGFNTDVQGIERVIREHFRDEHTDFDEVHVLGSGATAASAIAACAALKVRRVVVRARNQEAAAALARKAQALGLSATTTTLDSEPSAADIVVSTLPGDARSTGNYSARQMRHAFLLNVAYSPWPTRLAECWSAAGGSVTSGLPMLVYQAIAQMRVFVNEDPKEPLPNEDMVTDALFRAVRDRTRLTV